MEHRLERRRSKSSQSLRPPSEKTSSSLDNITDSLDSLQVDQSLSRSLGSSGWVSFSGPKSPFAPKRSPPPPPPPRRRTTTAPVSSTNTAPLSIPTTTTITSSVSTSSAPASDNPFEDPFSDNTIGLRISKPPKLPPRPNSAPSTDSLDNHTSTSLPEYPIRSTFTKDSVGAMLLCGDYLCYGYSEGIAILNIHDPSVKRLISTSDKVTCLLYINCVSAQLLAGLGNGDLYQLDVQKATLLQKHSAHNAGIAHLLPIKFNQFASIDDNGKVFFYQITSKIQKTATCKVKPGEFSCIVDDYLWTATGKNISVHQISTVGELKTTIQVPCGAISSICSVEPRSIVITGHEDGKICIINCKTFNITSLLSISSYKITSLLVTFAQNLWIGSFTGKIQILDLNALHRLPIKDFMAHQSSSVLFMSINHLMVMDTGVPIVATLSSSGSIRYWDAFLSVDKIDRMLWKQKEMYCKLATLTCQIITWNINSSRPVDLEQSRFWQSALIDSADILVVGFQEIVDLESGAVNAKEILKRDLEDLSSKWTNSVKLYLSDQYSVVESRQMVGLLQLVFVKNSLLPRLTTTCTTTVKTGLGGLHGNKGAIVTRLVIDDSSICFVNCHLAAHQTQVAARNSDLHTILKETNLEPINAALPGSDGVNITDNEFVFWFGDMNYRIDMQREDVLMEIEASRLSELLSNDQLKKQFETNHHFALKSFQEAAIKFAPTFKYDPGTLIYDTSEKKRIPAWCDRILFKGQISCSSYDRLEFTNSDHRPVTGLFSFQVKKQDFTSKSAFYSKIKSKIDSELQQTIVKAKVFWLIAATDLPFDECKRRLEQANWNCARALLM